MGKLYVASISYKALRGVAKQVRLVHTDSDDLHGEVSEGVGKFIKKRYPDMEVTGISIMSTIDLTKMDVPDEKSDKMQIDVAFQFYHTQDRIEKPFSVYMEDNAGNVLVSGYGEDWEKALLDFKADIQRAKVNLIISSD